MFVNLKANSESQKRRSLSYNRRVTFSFMWKSLYGLHLPGSETRSAARVRAVWYNTLRYDGVTLRL